MSIYFIADTHFNHDREFIWGPRGFKSIQEMNEAIITNWNNTVKSGDTVYVLGDFFLGEDFDYIKETINNLNGDIWLVRGNHDTNAKLELYHSLSPKILYAGLSYLMDYRDMHFYLSHYPTLTANLHDTRETAIFNIHGHTHSKQRFYEDRPYMYNVACDANSCTPVSFDQIISDIDAEIDKCKSFLV